MRLVFALYRYFPYGGLQRDMLRIARACVQRGATVKIVCAEWEGELPDGIAVERLRVGGMTNHGRHRSFSAALQKKLQTEACDLVVGFNKMPGIDVYYAADTCFKAKLMQERSPALQYLPRYRQYLRDEDAVFGCKSKTKILALAQRSVDEYACYYPGAEKRCMVLPPGINPDRRAGADAVQQREQFRRAWGLAETDKLVLMIGSGFRTKGLDRAVLAVAALPQELLSRTHFVVIGQDKPDVFLRLAAQHGIGQRIRFLAGRDDVPQFLLGADVLIHPAYRENTGTVLLEAAVAGLPVLTTAVCGYSHYIRQYDCGLVMDEPFSQSALNTALQAMLEQDLQRLQWQKNALQMANSADLYSLFSRAAEHILTLASGAVKS